MRIVIASPPKMGNKWLKCLLGTIYELEWLRGDDTPPTNPRQFKAWVDAGNFGENHIFHQHSRFTRRLADVVDAIPAHLVTIVRDPYDTFVSMYYWLQSRAADDQQRGKVRSSQRPRDILIGKPLDDPAVLAYLANGFDIYLRQAIGWIHNGRAAVVRYEDLHRDPLAALKRVTDQIEPVDDTRLSRAIEDCSVENMRKMSPKMASHIRSGTVGDSKQRLTEPHLEIFRERYGELIRSLGYDVR